MLRKLRTKPELTDEQRKKASLPDERELHTMQTAKTWVGWESRGKRERYCLMGEPD